MGIQLKTGISKQGYSLKGPDVTQLSVQLSVQLGVQLSVQLGRYSLHPHCALPDATYSVVVVCRSSSAQNALGNFMKF